MNVRELMRVLMTMQPDDDVLLQVSRSCIGIAKLQSIKKYTGNCVLSDELKQVVIMPQRPMIVNDNEYESVKRIITRKVKDA